MLAGSGSGREAVVAAFDELDAAFDKVLGLSFEAITDAEKVRLLDRLERNARRAPMVRHQLVSALAAEADPKALGATTLAEVLATALRISMKQARRHIKHAELLGPRRALTGEPLEPVLAHTAAAQQRGLIGAEHLSVIETFFHQLPAHVSYDLAEAAEAQLAELACGLGPVQLRAAAERLAALIDQDGAEPTDAQRARKRHLTIGRQDIDGMSPIHGLLDPQARATLDAVLAKLAAPGMCNPDEPSPCVDGDPDPDSAARDVRTPAQRRHDALTALGRAMLASGQLGQHNGLPATIIVSTTLQELHSGAGPAVTAAGTLLPISDVIRLAAHAHHYLAVFDTHTRQPLYLGHAKRLASPGQRIVLLARDRGCTRPGCTAPGYWCQAHHVEGWAAHNSPTNIDKLTLACGPDNRLVEQGRWTTRVHQDGRTQWIPPPHLDTGQTRVNNYHHPEKYLLPEDDDDDP